MILVSTFKAESPYLPEEFLNSLPEECPTCKSPTQISESLTQLSCINLRCPSKVIQRMCALAKDLGILGVGEALAEQFITIYKISNHLNLFDCNTSLALAQVSGKFQQVCEQMENHPKQFTLGEFLKVANLPHLRDGALTLAQGYSTLDELYSDVDNGGIEFIQSQLGINPDSISIRSQKIYDTLMEFREDLYEGAELVSIRDLTNVKPLKVCISDSPGEPFTSKKDFMAQANSIPGYHITFVEGVSKSLDALVWGGGRYTSKVRKVESYPPGLVPIYTGVEFISAMKSGVL